jgi:hypothetical protein
MKLISDDPISDENEDIFGFKKHVEVLGKAILEAESLPFTIGILGKWGTGKTSLMHLLCNWLIRNGFKTLWFNPWYCKNEKELKTTLMREVLIKVYQTTTKQRLKQNVWRLLKDFGWPTFDGDLFNVSGGVKLPDNVSSVQRMMLLQELIGVRFQDRFEVEFSYVVDEFVGKKGKLIIFIDDLERPHPENVITVLDFLREYSDTNRCVFVLGIDKAMIELGIKERYGKQPEEINHKYIKKNIHFPFLLPPIKFEKIRNFFQSNSKAIDFSPQIWALIQYGLGSNPRKIKRFVNIYNLIRGILNRPERGEKMGVEVVEHGGIDAEISFEDELFYLAKVLTIKSSFKDFYQYLLKKPSGWSSYEKIINAKRQFKKDELLKKGITHNEPSKEDLLDKNLDLVPHWRNRYLRVFMQHTMGEDFPKSPSPAVLKRVMKFAKKIEESYNPEEPEVNDKENEEDVKPEIQE